MHEIIVGFFSIFSPCNLIKNQSRLKRSHVSLMALKISIVSELIRKRCVGFSWVVSGGMDRKEIWIEFELSGEEPMMSYHYQLPRNMRGNKHFPAQIFTLLLFCTQLPCAPQRKKRDWVHWRAFNSWTQPKNLNKSEILQHETIHFKE